ncbi:phosphoribosylanthranilate isomerase [Gilvimarinus sp. DA14]|uniref:phosphoribosylanthranilate isomerase n=1 Tax=Gilvimarinus sp. DA14 TaxID=2956798 RepID=UPI0020B6B5EF|nr:phosphoribosylanthranilate isomerase [Gilvimarinus sp. DA14]UTF60987.1 phosphoribosylanthranilate isomerase [Gilvimarinus sp. DA14]
MFTPRVKICGVTEVAQARAVVTAGADAIGLVFYPKSPRAVDIESARQIALACGPFVTTVGLFVNASVEQIETVLNRVPLQLLQFHGDETREFCEQFDRPYIKALRMRPELDVSAAIDAYSGACGVLLDAYRPGVPGGTGDTFDWARFPQKSTTPLVLAGGLQPANVAQAVIRTGCYGVDVSGGVESAPGQKSPELVQQFIENAKQAYAKGERE